MQEYIIQKGYGHSAQVECRSVVDDGPLVLGVFGAWPTSLLLWHIRRVRDCGMCIERLGVYRGVDTNRVTVVATHSKPVME